MRTTVSKWGNSLAIRLPKAVADTHGLREGAAVEITEVERGILIRPVHGQTLEGLLEQVTEQNQHGEAAFGTPVGKETW